MSGTPLAFLFLSVPATFPSDYPLAESIERLRTVCMSSRTDAWWHGMAVGRVNEDAVWLERPFGLTLDQSGLRFIGSFRFDERGVILSGQFDVSEWVRVRETLGLGCTGLMTALVGICAVVKPAEAWRMPFAGLGVIALMMAGMKLNRWLARNDVGWLSEIVEEALTHPDKLPNHTPEKPGWLIEKFHGWAGQ